MPSTFIKDPDAVLDYKFDWASLTNGNGESDWLSSSETIISIEVTSDSGIIIDSSALSDSNTSIVVWLSGGTAKESYSVSCEIVTSQDRTDERSIFIYVRER